MDIETELNTPDRLLIADWVKRRSKPKVLDLGVSWGCDCLNILKYVPGAECYGVDVESYRHRTGGKNIQFSACDIEKDSLPYQDKTFDVVVANMVLEHCKNWFWIVGEVSRVLKPSGIFIVSMPNLTQLTTRFKFLLGEQPICTTLSSGHIRGTTAKAFVEFTEKDGYFKFREMKGFNLYPFNSKTLDDLFPTFCANISYLFQRTEKKGVFNLVMEHEWDLDGTNFKLHG